MFEDIIDAFTNEGETTRGTTVEVTRLPAGHTHNVTSPRVDAGHLLLQIRITDSDKSHFVLNTLGFDTAEDLYHTDVEDWIKLNKRYGRNLNPKDINLLAGLCAWYPTFSNQEKDDETFNLFVKHGILNTTREYL